MIILGITGQTGAGKTTLLSAVHQLKGESLDCDALYWYLLQTDTALCKQLQEAFGDICNPSGEIDRKKLGKQVFASPEKLLQLNKITHPIILKKVDEFIEKYKKQQVKLFAIDAIALFESGLDKKCHQTIAVTASESIRIERIMLRDDISKEYAQNRVKAQKDNQFYQENSDFVLENLFPNQEDFLKYTTKFLDNILKEI